MITIKTSADKKSRTITVGDDHTSYTARLINKKWAVKFDDMEFAHVGAKQIEAEVEKFEAAREAAAKLPRRKFAHTDSSPWYDTRNGANIKGEHVFEMESEIVAVTEHWVRYKTTKVVSEKGRPDASIAREASIGGAAATWLPIESVFERRNFRWI